MRRPKKYPRPTKPSLPEEMLLFNGDQGLSWGKANLIDFWLVGVAAVETEDTSDGRVGWIAADNNGTWENALNNTALLLIRMYCLMAVDLPELEVCDIAVRRILRSVATFEFTELTPARKSSLVCNSLYMPYSLEGLEPHSYSSVPTPTFPSPVQSSESWDEGPSSPQETVGARTTALFNTQILPMEAKFRAVSEAKDSVFTKSHAQALTSSVHDVQFPPAPHRLDSFRAPAPLPEVATEIGSLYSRLPFGGKCALHRQLIEVEMQRLSVLIAQAADRREDLKQELVFITAAEQRRARRIATLREVKESNAAIKKEVTARKAALDVPSYTDDEDEVPTGGVAGPNNSHNPPRAPRAPRATTIAIDDDSDVEEQLAYEKALIDSSRD